MSQTENQNQNSSGGEERIRKVYAKDLKNGEAIHTVFRATAKEKHTSRVGKSYLTLTLVDRTGEVDARIFENVDAADGAFTNDDYLLVQGKVGNFHGKAQVVVDRLERLDAGPIDPKEFVFVAPKEERHERPEKAERAEKTEREPKSELKLPKRVAKLLENPQVAQAFDALLAWMDRTIDEKVAARLGEKPATGTQEKREKPQRGPKVEHKGERHEKPEHRHEKPELKRDPSLPEGLAFKPFTQLVGDGAAEAPAATNSTPGTTEG